jgi:VanZ family protein
MTVSVGKRGRILLAAAPAVSYMILIYVLSSRPPPDAVVSIGVKDSWLHLVEYAVLGALLANLAWAITGRRGAVVLIPLPALIGALYGASDEWHQSFVPIRDASGADFAMDAIGSILGAAAYWVVRGIRRP